MVYREVGWTIEMTSESITTLSDCLSGKSTRCMPDGRFVGEGGIPEPRARWLRDDARV